jgi:hypothetical protein
MEVPTRPLRDFLPLVLPHAQYCPRPVAEQYLRLAAIEWCERTRCWRHVSTMDLTEQGEAIVSPDYATIFEIESAEFSSETVSSTELVATQFTQISLSDAEAMEGNAPRYITQVSPNSVTVLPFMVGSLSLSLFLKPRAGTEYGNDPADPLQDKYNVIPEHVFIQSAEKIAEGALARLLAIKDTKWHDPKMAGYYAGRFNEACDRHFSSELRGQQRAPRRSRPEFI